MPAERDYLRAATLFAAAGWSKQVRRSVCFHTKAQGREEHRAFVHAVISVLLRPLSGAFVVNAFLLVLCIRLFGGQLTVKSDFGYNRP
jgi:predicted HTH domain antitoxin